MDEYLFYQELEKEKAGKKMFKKGVLIGTLTTLFFGLTLVLVVGAAILLFPQISTAPSSVSNVNLEFDEKMEEIDEIIRRNFLFTDNIEEQRLIEGMFSGYVDALGDPYTVYFDQETTRQLAESRTGSFFGIGANLIRNQENGLVEIVSVFSDSPAEGAGLASGDFIIQVDERKVGDQDLTEVVSWIRGEEGTPVDLTVLRDGEELQFTVYRANIQITSVYFEMMEDNVGYIRVTAFDGGTGEQFREALETLEAEGMDGLIIDLRNNFGGNLDVVVAMARDFVPEGLIVSIEDSEGRVTEFNSNRGDVFDIPLVVLVNQNSASASEIFAGAIQDHELGTIVGMTTFGKGLVQRIFTLSDGSSLKVTIAEYFTPSGRSIHEEGIVPDVEVEFDFGQEVDDPEDIVDNQLEKSIEVLMEKMR